MNNFDLTRPLKYVLTVGLFSSKSGVFFTSERIMKLLAGLGIRSPSKTVGIFICNFGEVEASKVLHMAVA